MIEWLQSFPASECSVSSVVLIGLIARYAGRFLHVCFVSPSHYRRVQQRKVTMITDPVVAWDLKTVESIAIETVSDSKVFRLVSHDTPSCSWVVSIVRMASISTEHSRCKSLASLDVQLVICGCQVATAHRNAKKLPFADFQIGIPESETRQESLRNILKVIFTTSPNNSFCLGCTSAASNAKLERYSALIRDGTAEIDDVTGVIRSSMCTRTKSGPTGARCSKCQQLYKLESTRHSRRERAKSKQLSKFTPFAHLSEDQMLTRLNELSNTVDNLRRANLRLRREMQEQRSAYMQRTLSHPGLDTLLLTLYGSDKEALESKHHVDTISKMDNTGALAQFWKSQLEYMERLKAGLVPGMRWDDVTIRFALSIAARSMGAYEVLRNSGLLHLPHVRGLKSRFAAAAGHSGLDLSCFEQAQITFRHFRDNWTPPDKKSENEVEEKIDAVESQPNPPSNGDHVTFADCKGDLDPDWTTRGSLHANEPLGQMCILFDEMNIRSGLVFNASRWELHGVACDYASIESMTDILTIVDDIAKHKNQDQKVSSPTSSDKDKVDSEISTMLEKLQKRKTRKMLQFMLRDLTSSFDFMGPYFEIAEDLNAEELYTIIQNIIDATYLYGFVPRIIVADGLSVNMSAFRFLTGGTLTVKHSADFVRCAPYFLYEGTGQLIFVSLDPTHVYKSARNALYNSKPGGVRMLNFFGKNVTWTHISDVWLREEARARAGRRETDITHAAIYLTNYSKMRYVC